MIENRPHFERLQSQILKYIVSTGFVPYRMLIRRIHMLLLGLPEPDQQYYKSKYQYETNISFAFITPLLALGILDPAIIKDEESETYRAGIKPGTLEFNVEGESLGYAISPFTNQFYHEVQDQNASLTLSKQTGLHILQSCPKVLDIIKTFSKEPTIQTDQYWNLDSQEWSINKEQAPFVARVGSKIFNGNFVQLESHNPLRRIPDYKENFDAFNIARSYLYASKGKAFYVYDEQTKQLALANSKTANTQTIVISRALLLFDTSQLLNKDNYHFMMSTYKNIPVAAVKELRRIFGDTFVHTK